MNRYYSGALGRFTSPDNPKFSEKTDSLSWNLYTYAGNNPLVRIDPLGLNWFNFTGSWQWFEGSDVTSDGKPCERSAEGCHHSDYTHIITYEEKYRSDGTSFGIVTLYGNNGGFVSSNIIAQDEIAFSGGAEGRSPAEAGNYEINLNKRGGKETQRLVSYLDTRLAAFHNGIQEIGGPIYAGYDTDAFASPQWGDRRAHLIPLQGQSSENYLHGKGLYFTEGLQKTHACIATPYEKVLTEIFKMNPKGVGEGKKNGRIVVSVQGTR